MQCRNFSHQTVQSRNPFFTSLAHENRLLFRRELGTLFGVTQMSSSRQHHLLWEYPFSPHEESSHSTWRYRLAYILFLLGMLPVFLFLSTERFPSVARWTAWAGLSCALFPILRLLSNRRARPSAVAGLVLMISLCYFFAVLHEERLLLRFGEARITEGAIQWAIAYAALGVVALQMGSGLGGLVGMAQWIPKITLPLPNRALLWCGSGIVSASLLLDLLRIRGLIPRSPQLISVLSALSPIDLGYAMLLLPSLNPHQSRKPLLFWLFTGISSLTALMSGSLVPMVQPLLTYLLAWLLVRRRLRVWPIALGMLVVLLFQPVKGEFRAKVWDREARLSLMERAELFVDLSARHWFGGDTDRAVDRERSVKIAAARTASALQLAHIMEMTPAAVPFQQGATYRYFRYALLPRAFFPDKPSAQYADTWAAVMYGYTTVSGTQHVMVGLPQLAETYLNFGVFFGLLLVAFCGFVLRAVDEMLAHPQAGTGAAALYLFFAHQVVRTFEGSAAQFWGGALQQFSFYALLLWCLGVSYRLAAGRTKEPFSV